MDFNLANCIYFGVFGTGFSVFMFRLIRSLKSKKCKCVNKRMKTIVITGASSGLGEACAYELANRNCKLILGCRNIQKGEKIVQDLNKKHFSAKLIPLDLCDLNSIQQFCSSLCNEKIDVLINNAGVMMGHFRLVQSTQTEEDMSVNYLSHFYLTNLLLSNMKTQYLSSSDSSQNQLIDPARIIFVSSSLSKRGRLNINNHDLSEDPYNPVQAYANSKLALCLFARELHKRLNSSEQQSQSRKVNVMTMFTGGMVNTGLSRNIISGYSVCLQPFLRCLQWLLLKDPKDVCHSMVHCAISDELNDSSDKLFVGFDSISWPDRVTESMSLCDDLWIKSSEILKMEVHKDVFKV